MVVCSQSSLALAAVVGNQQVSGALGAYVSKHGMSARVCTPRLGVVGRHALCPLREAPNRTGMPALLLVACGVLQGSAGELAVCRERGRTQPLATQRCGQPPLVS